MNARVRDVVADWPKVAALLALLLLSLFIAPHAPLGVRLAFGALLLVSSFWAAASALRFKWREAKMAGAFVSYAVWLTATAFVIAFGCFLIFCIALEFVP